MHISKVEVAILYSINKRQHQTPSTEKTVEKIKTKAKWKWLHVIIFFENNYFRFRAFEYWKLVLFFEPHQQKKRIIKTLKKINVIAMCKIVCSALWLLPLPLTPQTDGGKKILRQYTFAEKCWTLEQIWIWIGGCAIKDDHNAVNETEN